MTTRRVYPLLLSITALIALLAPLHGADEILFSKIGIEKGLSQLSVMTIYQDELGNMWFGTREGLNIYNGNRMKVLQPDSRAKHTLSGNLIKNIDGDDMGNVYIHTQNGIDLYELRSGFISQIIKIQVNAMIYEENHLWYALQNRVYKYNPDGAPLLVAEVGEEEQITALLPTSDGRLYIGTVASGIYRADRKANIAQILDHCGRISHLYEDSRKNIWVSSWDEGLYRIGTDGKITNFRKNKDNPAKGLSSDFVRVVCEDNEGDLWIGTRQGLDKLDRKKQLFSHYDSELYDDRSLSNESIWALYKDKQGNIWIGTYFGGVNHFHPRSNTFTSHNLRQGIFATRPFPVISEIVPYRPHSFLLCTEGDGLLLYNSQDKSYSEIALLKNENIKTAYYDRKKEKLYLGIHLGGLAILDLNSGHLKRFSQIRTELNQSNIVRKILPYRDDLLIATYNGLYLYDQEEESFSVFSEALHQHVTYFVDVAIDGGNQLWIASRGVYLYNNDTKETRTFFHDPSDLHSISNNNATKLLVDSHERIWIATGGGGVNRYDRASGKFIRTTSRNSHLQNDYLSNIAESPMGHIYLTTTQGLSYLNPENGEVINLSDDTRLSLNSLFNGGITILPDGEIFVAGMNGMVSFNERDILNDLPPIRLYFSSLWVNNQEVEANDETQLLEALLPYTKRLKFNHQQSILKFEFASDQIVSQKQYQYSYRVKGLSNEWISLMEGINEINLISIEPGNYWLELVAASPGSKALLGATEIPFQVTPPFYKSTLAYLIYILAGLLLIFFYVRYITDKVRLESSLAYEKKEKEHIEEVNRSKLQFFTNISHEFRTPLTLIATQAEMLMQQGRLQQGDRKRLQSIFRNTTQMKNLINELLDFRKIDNDKLEIQASEQDIVEFIREIYTSFVEYANDNRIDYRMQTTADQIPLWFDRKQLQKVFVNLLSNAFKFTPAEGKITIQIGQDEEKVLISISDTGPGISPENIDRIFDRFYQIESDREGRQLSPGTGIGLALTKWIVDAHHGKIKAESVINEGSSFRVTLLTGSAHFSDHEKGTAQTADMQAIHTITHFPGENELPVNDPERKIGRSGSLILIVEDNEELLQVLRSVFDPFYEVITARNGEEGLRKTMEQQPDIVISDLMMPVMSGSEMCLKIKSNFAVCHIPVILLTAQTAVEANIEGLKLGADDYITKPFEVDLLLARCNNLIRGRKILQEKFAKSPDHDSLAIASNEIDRTFLERANNVIEKQMENPEFGVNEFSQEMNLGRTTLFQKIKGITGQTPNEFIVTFKMKKASFLLLNNPELNIADVTYRLGFSSPKYFSKCFKDQFGMTPSEFRSNQATS